MNIRSIFALLLMLAGACASAQGTWPSQSIYNLDAKLTDQAGKQHGLDVHAGHPVLVTMFYSTCPMACPMLIDTVRSVERALDDAQRNEVRVLLISIDPEKDTTAALAALAKTRRIDTSRWSLVHTDATTVRKLAAVLNVQYRKLPDGQFNHSSIVTVLSPKGEILNQSATLGSADATVVDAIGQVLAAR